MIDVRDLEFTYPGSSGTVVKGLQFEVSEGEIFGFLGPSGAGKSTTQKILTGLLRDFRGDVSVLGRDLRGLTSDFYEEVGVSFEFPNLYLKLSARENLHYFGGLFAGPIEDADTLLSRLGLADDADLRVSQYSKGMKARLGFARALLHRPRVLFLDEPTAGLDPVNAQIIKEMISELRDRGRTIFLTTHDMNTADQLCDRVAFIVDGALRCIDSPRQLKLDHGRRNVRVEYRANGSLASEEFPLAGIGDNTAFLGLLRDRRDEIETVHTQETTLERVFIEVTGTELS